MCVCVYVCAQLVYWIVRLCVGYHNAAYPAVRTITGSKRSVLLNPHTEMVGNANISIGATSGKSQAAECSCVSQCVEFTLLGDMLYYQHNIRHLPISKVVCFFKCHVFFCFFSPPFHFVVMSSQVLLSLSTSLLTCVPSVLFTSLCYSVSLQLTRR